MSNDLFGQQFFSPASSGKKYLLLFLMWPLLAFILAVKNYSQKEAKKVVYIFFIYYGLTFVIGELGGAGSDSERYAMRLIETAKLPFTDFFKIIGGLYATETSVDIIEPLISFIVSRFTNNHHILFAVFAAIFGYFYLKSINLLHDRYRENPGLNSFIILCFFVMVLPITTINGFRMWTAGWIFFLGAYHVILYRDARYLLLTFGASLVHFSYLSANVILLLYYIIGNRNIIYLPIAISSFILPSLLAPTFRSLSIFLGGAFANRYEGYSSENYGIARQEELENASWFIQIGTDLVLYYFIFSFIIIQLRDRNMMNDKPERNLFSFILLFLSFVNFGSVIPSFGGRFIIIFFLFASLYLFLYNVKLSGQRISLLNWIGLFPLFLYAAINFRMGSESINAWLLAPGFGIPLLDPVVSVYDLIFK